MSSTGVVDGMVNKANSFFIDEQFNEALSLYNGALKLEPDNADVLVKRSACNYALKKFLDAISDASQAIKKDPKLSEAYYKKGVALFVEEEYESAYEAFLRGQKLSGQQKYEVWIRKCKAELGESGSSTIQSISNSEIEEIETAKPKDDKVQEAIVNIEKVNKMTEEKPKNPPRFRHDWYQTDGAVIVSLFAKNIKNENLSVEIEEKNLLVVIKLENGQSEFVLDIPLFSKVIPSESKHTLTSSRIEINLKKAASNRWDTLQSSEPENFEQIPIKTKLKAPAQVYPSSKGPKDWDAIAKSEPDEELHGDAALNQFFQSVYVQGNDDQRRAMMKSFVESNGTVLSTDWKQIGAGKVETTPPQGLEVKRWDE